MTHADHMNNALPIRHSAGLSLIESLYKFYNGIKFMVAAF